MVRLHSFKTLEQKSLSRIYFYTCQFDLHLDSLDIDHKDGLNIDHPLGIKS